MFVRKRENENSFKSAVTELYRESILGQPEQKKKPKTTQNNIDMELEMRFHPSNQPSDLTDPE